MISLHERLSEFSYGYGVTRETTTLLTSIGLLVTPFLPSLLHEAELGFDVGFQERGYILVLQFKLGNELRRFHRANKSLSIPLLERPFWRYRVDTTEAQFQRLLQFETSGADTYYVAPRFSSWGSYCTAFHDDQILENSLLLRPREIQRGITAKGGSPGVHSVVYDRLRRYVCSEPTQLEEVKSEKLLTIAESRVKEEPLARAISRQIAQRLENNEVSRLL